MKKFLLVIISLLVVLTSNVVLAVNFSDLTSEHWAYEPIIEMANKGILKGYPDGTFLPNKSITRAEFAKILVLSLNLKDTNKNNFFDDVDSSHWSYDYVRIASNYLSGYTNGSKVYFMPDEQAVREDMAVAIVMATNLQNKQYDLKTLDRFSDKDSISESFKKYVAIAVENNLMHGNANGTFNPKGKLTRAEVSQLMLNTTKELEKVAVNDSNTKGDIKASANKKSGTTLKSSDSIKLYSEGYVFQHQYKIMLGNQVIMKSLYENNEILKVSDIMKNAEKFKIMLLGEEIKLILNNDDSKPNYDEAQDVVYTYKIVPDVDFELTPKDGTTLTADDEIKFKAKGNFNIDDAYSGNGYFDYYYEVYYNNTHFCVGSFATGGTLKASKIIDDAIRFGYNLSGKDIKIVVALLWSSMDSAKNLYQEEFKYSIKPDFVSLSAHPNITYKGDVLKSDCKITLNVAGNSSIKTFNYKIYHFSTLLSRGMFGDGDVLYVSDILKQLNDINIASGPVTIVLYYNDIANNEEKYETRYTYNVEPKEIKSLESSVSTNKKSGTTLKSSDSIKLYSNGNIYQYKVMLRNQVIMKSRYQNNDILKVSDIMKNAENFKIMLLGEEIKLILNIDDTIMGYDDAQDVTYTYKIVPDIDFELTPNEGTTLTINDEVKFKTKGSFNIDEAYDGSGYFDYYYEVYYNNTHFCVGSFASGGTIKVSEMIDNAIIFGYNLSGKDVKVVVSLLWSSMDGAKNLYKKEFKYTIQESFVSLSAHPSITYKGDVLKSNCKITLNVAGNSNVKTFDYKIYRFSTLLTKGTFKNGDVLYVSDILKELNNIHIASGEIVLVLYYDNIVDGEEDFVARYTYNIEP